MPEEGAEGSAGRVEVARRLEQGERGIGHQFIAVGALYPLALGGLPHEQAGQADVLGGEGALRG